MNIYRNFEIKNLLFFSDILNGYERITEIADTLTPLVIEMRDHLQAFSLTWQLMNQCMYYRFLYVDIESRMAECILRLKDAVDAETYKNFVMRFIKFDEEMQQVGQVWEVSLVALDLFRKSTPEQLARVERIMMIQNVTKSLKELKDIPEVKEVPPALALDWIVSSENEEVWLGVLNLLREKCDKKMSCSCWACLMSKRNSSPENCATTETNDGEKGAEDVYHLAHAVFKHLKDREVYSKPRVSPENFCVFSESPCDRLECSVATNLIVGSYPLSFTKFLLRTYQPLSTEDREKYLKVPSQSLIRKFCLKKGGTAAKEIMQEADEINHSFLLLNMFWDDDDIADPILRAGLAAALAENFKIDVKLPQKHIIFSYFYALFRVVEGDLSMDDEWLEKVNVANLFKSFGVVVNEPPPVDAIEMTLNELKITADVSSSNSNVLDRVQFSMKEVADKLSSISLTDDKAVLENEIKKPLVEALKLAASNKKLEAELKSLQKEHNMLKDMVKGLEQIHGEKKEVQVTVEPTKCGHSHGSPSTPEKDSADCVCYYCTLFGKNQDLMNTRSTETRDRLRKRLHSLQNQGKSKNLKNISLLLKNEKQQQQQVTPPAVPSTPPQHKCSASMKMKVELELQQRAAKKKVPAPVAKNPPEAVKIQRATEINLKSLENLVEYIEGPTSRAVVEHKKAEEIKAKKEQKKQRQVDLKIRRQIDLSLEKLEKINGELQEVVTDAKQISNQLSQLKAGKGKAKKVETTEEKLSELNGRRAKLEGETRFICGEIKELSGNVDFARECGEMKAILGVLGITPAPAAKVKVVQPPQPRLLQQIKIDTSDDPAKRMVTIRRINLPHAEPQVTVTAKGTTPDMDQLLYTFVNGQLVPASSLSPSAFQNGSIQLFMSSNGQTKMVVGNHGQDLSQIKTLKIKEDLQTILIPANKKKTEKSVKKEIKKKKEEILPPPAIPAPIVLKKEVKKPTEVLKVMEKPKKKVKKAYIDPEFAANPFKLLDEEGQPSESEEEEIVEPVKKVEVFEPVKVVKEKKPKKEKKVKGPERKDSVTSVASSNASKESKKNLPIENFVVQPSMFTSATKPVPMNSSSIMDQLNRGVRVEGLRLPPGITLTKVAPGESIAGKRESINRVSFNAFLF